MYNDRELLAKTLMAEAGNQGPLGMLAAGSVIMNRVRSGNYGQGLQGVILRPGAFSPWNSVTGFAGGEQGQDMARITPSEQAYRIADALLSGKYEDPTNNATHFYNPDISDPSWGIRGGNEWRRIGAHVFGRADDKTKGPSRVVNVGADAPKFVASDTMAALGKGGGAVTPDQIAQSAQAQSTGTQEEQRPRGLLGGLLGNPDTMANLAMAFNSMRLNPDPNLGSVLSARIADRRAERKEKGQMNKTADWLESQGATQLAAGVRGGGLPVASALGMYQNQVAVAQNPNVQSSQMLRDYSGTILTMRDGSIKVLTSGGQELSGQEAMDFIKASEANFIQGQKDIAGARREGTLTSDIQFGGEVERVKAEGKAAPEIARANFEDAQTVRSTITNIDNAIAAIDQGAKSGIVYNMLPNMTLASASLSNAMDRLGLDVIGSVTFGALSEGELRLAMETAVPRNLPPAELRQWLVKHKEAQERAYRALLETAQHFAGGGTMDEYLRKIGASGGSSTTQQTTQQPAGKSSQLSDDDLLKMYSGSGSN